jgi:polysaccharide biosynthesis/export protein
VGFPNNSTISAVGNLEAWVYDSHRLGVSKRHRENSVVSLSNRVAAMCLVLLIAGCATKTVPPPKDEAGPVFTEEYRIGIGDNLKVDVYRNPDLSVGVVVRPDGKITVPVAGDVAVGGQTPEEVSKTIAAALAEYIRDPIVTTTVVGMGENEYLTRVRVTGAVGKPSSLQYRNGMTVLDVVLECGGVNAFANPGGTVLYRASGEHLKIRLDRLLKGKDMSTNYAVRPGDVITVPERLF